MFEQCRNLILALALMPIQLLPQQDPITVKLSDGRVVPYGPGVICDDQCYEDIDLTKDKKAWWVIPVASSIILCSVLCRHSKTTITDNPPTPNITEVPEPISLVTLGFGFILIVFLSRRRKNASC